MLFLLYMFHIFPLSVACVQQGLFKNETNQNMFTESISWSVAWPVIKNSYWINRRLYWHNAWILLRCTKTNISKKKKKNRNIKFSWRSLLIKHCKICYFWFFAFRKDFHWRTFIETFCTCCRYFVITAAFMFIYLKTFTLG